jgi:RNA polymerase sigma-70 factor (ECF subfamily)
MSEFETFYRQHVGLVHALARARSADTWQAEDLAQDAFLRAWQHFGSLRSLPPPAQRAWLSRTVRNLSIDAWRRAAAAPELLGMDDAEAVGDHQVELHVDLARAMATLGEEDREIVTLRYLGDLNSREIGEAMGMPEGTVRRRLAESRKALAEQLAAWAPAGEVR